MIQDNEELYALVRNLSRELRNAGEERWSTEIDDALSISSAPGEILGATRLQLQRLRASQVPIRLGLTLEVDDAISYLDYILGSSQA